VLRLVEHADFRHAVPTPDHFIPLLYTAAMAAASDTAPRVLIEGYAYGSLSMTCFTVGADCPVDDQREGAAQLPAPEVVPPEQSNM
jgi:4,5-DOPA dioxygenase extradiol